MRTSVRAIYLVSLAVGVVVALASVYAGVFTNVREDTLVALSYLWVPSIVLGGYGLTLGRNSLKRSLVVAACVLVMLCAFFLAVWPQL